MRRILLPLTVAAALVVPASAGAASWTGVIVAKDGARKAVVTASASGKLRTVRVPVRYASLRLGQRIAVKGAARADGTYRSRAVRLTGRAAKAKVSAVLVRYQRAARRYIVSGGGSVFALRAKAARRLAGAGDASKPGDKVDATVTISGGTVSTTGVTTTGHSSTIELEGIFIGLSGSTLQLAVVSKGLVSVTVPAGVTLPELKPGDEIELVVSVGADGSFTLAALDGDDGDEDGIDHQDDEELEISGRIVSLSPFTIQPDHGAPITCAVPAGLSLNGFTADMEVEIECEQTGSGFVLTEIEVEDDDEDAEDEHEDEDHDDGDEDDEDDDETDD